MEYARILVHLDGAPGCTSRAALAARLCQRFGSRIVAVAPSGDITLSSSALPRGVAAVAALEDRRLYEHQRARTRCNEFLVDVSPCELLSVEAHVVDRDPQDALLEAGRCCDLVVIGQPQDGDQAFLARSLLMTLGRPMLMVPFVGEFIDVGRRVMLAWDDSRECVRAAADAMGFLRQADDVCLCQVTAGEAPARMAARSEAALEWLSANGVQARLLTRKADGDIGNVLLSLVCDESSDLLVMGGYGHSPLREAVFGGTSRTVLQSMTVPVLMSH